MWGKTVKFIGKLVYINQTQQKRKGKVGEEYLTNL